MVSPAADLDLTLLGALHFEAPDILRFPALGLAYQAGQTGGTMPAVLNAANEVAVNKFLKREIAFTDIAILVERVMEVHDLVKNPNLESILQADSWPGKGAMSYPNGFSSILLAIAQDVKAKWKSFFPDKDLFYKSINRLKQ
jgi:1-deoxy-D-xylulose-5-phosphate reductoisomerase